MQCLQIVAYVLPIGSHMMSRRLADNYADGPTWTVSANRYLCLSCLELEIHGSEPQQAVAIGKSLAADDDKKRLAGSSGSTIESTTPTGGIVWGCGCGCGCCCNTS
jgi:hypothetical protein